MKLSVKEALDQISRLAIINMVSGPSYDILQVLKKTEGYEIPSFNTCERCKIGVAEYMDLFNSDFYYRNCPTPCIYRVFYSRHSCHND